jgi:hypothetical protein
MFQLTIKIRGFLTLSPQAEQPIKRINVWEPFNYKHVNGIDA